MMRPRLFVILLVAQLMVVSVFAAVVSAQVAGALYLSPSTGAHTIGSSFTVTVRVNTAGQPINASDGFITFDASQLAVVGVSRAGSIFNLWTSEPAFSNDAGSISYSGGTPTPYTGNGGAIMTITFRALRESSSTVRFSAGSILAADGKGTNIVGSLGSGVYTLSALKTTPVAPLPPRANTPAVPTLVSQSHPDQARWYPNPNATVAWTVPGGITAIRTSINQSPTSTPTSVVSLSAREQIFDGLDDGTWYAHVQFQNNEGWGGAAHYTIRVDTTDPTRFSIEEVHRDDLTEPRVAFTLEGEDEPSGLKYYDVQIDAGLATRFEDPDGQGLYQTEALLPGSHTILITAYDDAGNSLADSDQFSVVAIGSPKITEYTEQIRRSDIFVARGETFQNATVFMRLTPNGGGDYIQHTVQTGTDGSFTFVLDEKLEEGGWVLTAVVVDERGASSKPGNELSVIVGPSVFAEAGERTINFLSVLIPLLGTLFLLIFLIWYGWHRSRVFLGIIEKDTKHAESDIHEEFERLRTTLREHVAALEHASTKRDLSREEERMRKEISRQLEEAEKRLMGDLEDIEEDVLLEEKPIARLLRKLRRR